MPGRPGADARAQDCRQITCARWGIFAANLPVHATFRRVAPPVMKLPAQIYQQFDADYSRDVPAEGFGGWQTVDTELAPTRTALVVMHAWHCGAPGEFPGWSRAVEYEPRARKILTEIFPPLLAAVRASPLPVFHVVGGGRDYHSHLPGYRRAVGLAGKAPAPAPFPVDPVYEQLQALRAARSFVGRHNRPDVDAGFARLDFAPRRGRWARRAWRKMARNWPHCAGRTA
jgi:hypothetical protein